jgi:hypothetical protein
MSETDLVMYISRRNDDNGRLKIFRSFSLCHESSKYIETTETTKKTEILAVFFVCLSRIPLYTYY